MKATMKALAKSLPLVQDHYQRVEALVQRLESLVQERDRLADRLREAEAAGAASAESRAAAAAAEAAAQATMRKRKAEGSAGFRAGAATATLIPPMPPIEGHLDLTVAEWIRRKVAAEPYWFQRIEVLPGFFSPGWSDPAVEKLPHYGLPEDLTGMRVLDIGCAEGFFSFEAERRGAREVIAIDSFPDSVRRFNIVREARQSRATAFLMNVYDLDPKRLGTFDLVLFYGVFYHLRHPQLALERIRSVCTGTMLFQTHILEEPSVRGAPWAKFHPHGLLSGAKKELWDPTVFWLFNSAACLAMLEHVGFTGVEALTEDPLPFVARARSPVVAPGEPPDQVESPWS
jgi:tRNA (mo5U34)-methyltransferase